MVLLTLSPSGWVISFGFASPFFFFSCAVITLLYSKGMKMSLFLCKNLLVFPIRSKRLLSAGLMLPSPAHLGLCCLELPPCARSRGRRKMQECKNFGVASWSLIRHCGWISRCESQRFVLFSSHPGCGRK